MVYCGVPVWFSESLLRLPQELVSIEPRCLSRRRASGAHLQDRPGRNRQTAGACS